MSSSSDNSNYSTIGTLSTISTNDSHGDVFLFSDSSNEYFNIDDETNQNNETGQRVENNIFKNNLQFNKEQNACSAKAENFHLMKMSISSESSSYSTIGTLSTISTIDGHGDIFLLSDSSNESFNIDDETNQNNETGQRVENNIFKNNLQFNKEQSACSAKDTKKIIFNQSNDGTINHNQTGEYLLIGVENILNEPKNTAIDENPVFEEEIEKKIDKRNQPSNKQIIINYQDDHEKLKELSSKSLTKVNINNDYKFESNFDHSIPILCKNKNCSIYLHKSELFDNLHCTFECKKLNLEQTKQSINSENISCGLLKTPTVEQSPVIENPSRKRKQSFEPLLQNKIFLTECRNDCDYLNVPHCKLFTDVYTSSRSSPKSIDHLQYSFKSNNVQLRKTEDLKVSVIELKESAAPVTNNDNFLDEVKSMVPLFESFCAENLDELEQLEKSYQKLSIG
ncbi:Hypothetical protein CINCED_3A008860 [Cinara cedri]|uniref:Uncharacterized protein n=1 Tax=Cinara cedri TaxID=506608 RepID=A0A5E4N2V7_9HEMI|nr:Hypothetical protein CINCED_3A008860 [Cinara cedri]